MDKDQVAAILDEIGTLLELQGENPFRCNAYHNAARAIEQLESRPRRRRRARQARRHPRHRRHPARKDHHARHHRQAALLRRSAQARRRPACWHMLRMPGIGPKKVKALYDQLKHRRPRQAQGRLRGGPGRQAQGLRRQDAAEDPRRASSSSAQWATACASTRRCRWRMALLDGLRDVPGVIRMELCGSLRRRKETINDIDILISADDAGADHGALRQAAAGRAGDRPRRHQIEHHRQQRSGRRREDHDERRSARRQRRAVSHSPCTISPAARSTTSPCAQRARHAV